MTEILSLYISNASKYQVHLYGNVKDAGSTPFGWQWMTWHWLLNLGVGGAVAIGQPHYRVILLLFGGKKAGWPHRPEIYKQELCINQPPSAHWATNSTRAKWHYHHRHTRAIIPACQLPYITRNTPLLSVDALPANLLPKVIPQFILKYMRSDWYHVIVVVDDVMPDSYQWHVQTLCWCLSSWIPGFSNDFTGAWFFAHQGPCCSYFFAQHHNGQPCTFSWQHGICQSP